MACNSWDGKKLMSAFTRQSGHSLPITIFMYYITNFYFEVLSVSSVYSGFYLLLDLLISSFANRLKMNGFIMLELEWWLMLQIA